MIIEVSQQLISIAEEGSPWGCPIAIAVNGYLDPRRFYAAVTSPYIAICDRRLKEIIWKTKNPVVKFIKDFDKNGAKGVKPISFDLPIPDRYLSKSYREPHKDRKETILQAVPNSSSY